MLGLRNTGLLHLGIDPSGLARSSSDNREVKKIEG